MQQGEQSIMINEEIESTATKLSLFTVAFRQHNKRKAHASITSEITCRSLQWIIE